MLYQAFLYQIIETPAKSGRQDESNSLLVRHFISPDKPDAKRSHHGPKNIRALVSPSKLGQSRDSMQLQLTDHSQLI